MSDSQFLRQDPHFEIFECQFENIGSEIQRKNNNRIRFKQSDHKFRMS